jgi:hypothetical protein
VVDARKLASLLLVAGLACRPSSPESPPDSGLRVVDATQAYLDFLARGGEAPFDDEAEAFIDEVVAAYPELYSAEVIGYDEDAPQREQLRAVLLDYLPVAYQHRAEIEAVATAFGRDLQAHRASFEAAFPNFSGNADIYLTASLGNFDGGTRIVDDRQVLLFGVDGIAFYHAPGSDLAPFFHHELFHVHHGQSLEAAGAEPTAGTVGLALWGEGLASYVSKRLNPDAAVADLLLSDEMIRETDARFAELALELADNVRSEDGQLYDDYFLGGAGDRVPNRCGYYIGLRVAEHLAQTHSLQELANLHGEELDQHLESTLRMLAAEETVVATRFTPHPVALGCAQPLPTTPELRALENMLQPELVPQALIEVEPLQLADLPEAPDVGVCLPRAHEPLHERVDVIDFDNTASGR